MSKRVLIAGEGSYIGTRLQAYLQQAGGFEVRTLDVRAPFDAVDLANVDAVVQVAGIAHIRETAENSDLYFSVNRDLSLRIAALAKEAGVRQYVYLSSMSVYGMDAGHITRETVPAPVSAYGRSKLEAEQALEALQTDAFRVALVRPPMIYGAGCKGNYPRLARLILRTPVFPYVPNERSMLYIEHFCAFLRRLMESGEGGLFFPQNREYVSTGELARQIALSHGKQLLLPKWAGRLCVLASGKRGALAKVFGSLTYDKAMSADFMTDPQSDFATTIRETEGCA